MNVITNIIPSPEAVAAAVSNPGAVVEGVKQQAATVARGAEVLRSDPAKAATILNDNPRDVGRVLGEAAATAAMAKFDAGGTGCSFDADTPVATLAGQRAIGALEVGDTVLAFNEATGMLELDPVTHVWVNHDPAIEQLTLSGETLDTTPEHPFFTSERGWVAAGELLVGEHVRRLDGSWGVVEQLTIEARPVVMYNLTVARAHTFFVGDEGWLVHNECGPVHGLKTLEPGPHAGESIPARGPGRDFTAAERDSINRIGRETGCHTCGTTNPNTKGGNFIPDHQPPNALNPYNEPQRLYPHCSTCSRTQGGEIRTYQRRTRGVQE